MARSKKPKLKRPSPYPYRRQCDVKEYAKVRLACYTRDGRKCKMCGSKIKIQAHHILRWANYPGLRYDLNNLITLCKRCHDMIKGKEDYYIQYFHTLLMNAKKEMLIKIDTREKHPFVFYNKYGDLIQTKVCKLNTGDYTIGGMEDKLCIERKASVIELAGNCISSRFIRELERMSSYKHRYIILEFSLTDIMGYPGNTKLPPRIKNKIKLSGNFILTRLCQWGLDYDIQILPCGNRERAELMTLRIMQRLHQ
jgi:DNA excision repair protein ERCC-4